ncbi:MAG: ABC transporter ATP-binding protein [Gorillibacterium sp.]|nr:ABC transporter ATP-binding protein [Gorillibacterium sp.]
MIELKYVEKWYTKDRMSLYLDDVTINSGEIVGVLGENGSGKTTLLKAIMGIGELQNGQVLIDGLPVTEQYDKMAFITEEGSYLPNLTPRQYGDFLADFYPRFSSKHYQRLLTFYELEADRKIKTFSKGQKSKLEICAGFSKGAKYILMDEPFLGKDMFSRQDFLKLMVANLQGDETILITTHMIAEIENVLDRAIILHRGKIKRDFYMDDLRQEGNSLTAVLAEVSGYTGNRYKQVFE